MIVKKILNCFLLTLLVNVCRRRRITIQLMAERAGLSRATVAKIERGDPTTSMSGYASVLFALGMEDALADLLDSSRDFIGRRLEDEKLPQRIRISRKKRENSNEGEQNLDDIFKKSE